MLPCDSGDASLHRLARMLACGDMTPCSLDDPDVRLAYCSKVSDLGTVDPHRCSERALAIALSDVPHRTPGGDDEAAPGDAPAPDNDDDAFEFIPGQNDAINARDDVAITPVAVDL